MVQHEQDELALQNQLDSVERNDLEYDDGDEDDDEVSILMLGDPNSGKTSLVYTLVNDNFDPNVPAKMADIDISAEITPQNVPLHIVDYSDREQDHHDLENAITNANVVCIIYDCSDDEALDRVAIHWIPLIHKCANVSSSSSGNESIIHKPLILVANKIDLIGEEDDCTLEKVTRILQENVDIEAHIETSALNQRNVVELFATAQKAVVYPLAPLFDPQLRVLTKKCRNTLMKVYELCDLDGDGLLSDDEMNLFHENCFGVPLQAGALEDLKSVIKLSIMGGLSNDAITQTGFLFIHSLSIDKGRHEFTWQVLKKFNYDNQLNPKRAGNRTQVDADAMADNSSLRESLTNCSQTYSDRRNVLNSSSDYDILEGDESDSQSLIRNHLDPSWLREHGNLIKTGLGLTLATLMSMLALKFFLHNNNKSFA